MLTTALLAVCARIIGAVQPPKPALRAFDIGCEDLPQPCWFGVIPGKTTEPEINQLLAFAGEPELARTILAHDDYTLIFTLPAPWPYCRASFYFVDNVMMRGEISPCRESDMRVGDVALLQKNVDWIVSLPANKLVYDRVAINVEDWPAPFSRISLITLLPDNARFQAFPWRGFVSQRTYCQEVPSYPRC
ncbi:MAG: hypothetical protein ABI690_29715 [Chloroflexota bacterium]